MDYDPMMDYGNLPDMDENDIDYGLELIKWADKIAKEELAKEDDKDYVVNQKQMETFLRVQLYLMKLVKPEDGEWVHANVRSPKEKNGFITARFVCIDIPESTLDVMNGKAKMKIREFCDILSEASSFSISPTADGEFVDLDILISDVFIKKSNDGITMERIEQIADEAWDEFEAIYNEDDED